MALLVANALVAQDGVGTYLYCDGDIYKYVEFKKNGSFTWEYRMSDTYLISKGDWVKRGDTIVLNPDLKTGGPFDEVLEQQNSTINGSAIKIIINGAAPRTFHNLELFVNNDTISDVDNFEGTVFIPHRNIERFKIHQFKAFHSDWYDVKDTTANQYEVHISIKAPGEVLVRGVKMLLLGDRLSGTDEEEGYFGKTNNAYYKVKGKNNKKNNCPEIINDNAFPDW